MKVRSLKDLAAAINAIGSGYRAVVTPSWQSTDHKIRGTRLVSKGKGRKGVKLTVYDPTGEVRFWSDSAARDPLYGAIMKALQLFGSKLDLSRDEVFAPGTHVYVMDFAPLRGVVTKHVRKRPDQVECYRVELTNGFVTLVEPWRLRAR